jgi:signal transduction histidine kinase/ligand-binding sensor domain-containing protein
VRAQSSLSLRGVIAILLGCLCALPIHALNPGKSLTQYTRTIWTQEQGLPQDTIRAIAQTTDGYLWLGTDEGLARFDGYDFVIFNKENSALPSNSITALSAGAGGNLWIGTAEGLTCYRDKRFTTYKTKDGLPDNTITAVCQDHSGIVWSVAGVFLSRFQAGKFSNFSYGRDLPIAAIRTVYEDREHNIWIAGFGGVARLVGNKFVAMISAASLAGDIVSCMLEDRRGNLWTGGSKGLLLLSPSGKIRKFDHRDGLPDTFVRSLWEDRDGNFWVGTNGGLSRQENGRFVGAAIGDGHDRDWVRSIFEDREGNLWVGMNGGLIRLRDDVFTIYSRGEGLPSDEPTTVYQDRKGRIWVGFHGSGLGFFRDGGFQTYTTRNGLASNEIFSIREDRNGNLMVATRDGLSRMRGSRFTNFAPADPLGRPIVFDVRENGHGGIWLATAAALSELRNGHVRKVVDGGTLLSSAIVVLCTRRDGSTWAGTYGKGLWRVAGGDRRLYTTADGLSNDQIRALIEDQDGALWIGTFGGGLDCLQDGRFRHYTSGDGLLSDNISHIEDDGRGSLWLSTTRGICRVSKQQLQDLAAHRIASLTPVNYGLEDGLRSAQCAPGYPTSGGGWRTVDGRLWFPTSRGLAVLDPNAPKRHAAPVTVQLVDVTANANPVDLSRNVELSPENGRIQIRYTGIHLTAPERVRYSYMLEGLDHDWVHAGSRRIINYNSLRHGTYRFVVRADIDGGPASETSYSFRLLPHFYETIWFRLFLALLLAATAWAVFRLRVRQIRGRFALVLDERARLAREIHDTLAQGFVGISSQLDAVAMSLPSNVELAKKHLQLASRMARHSLTEARRSIMDLRAAALESQDLPAALQAGARQWTAGSPVEVYVNVTGELKQLPEEVEQHILRIAQEAVANVVKHAAASSIWIRLHMEARRLCLRVEDDGRGFEQQEAFSTAGGHFGLLGMRERAERMEGTLNLTSQPGDGTQVEVTVPLE